MKILVKEKIADTGIDKLREQFEVDVKQEWTQEELAENIAQYDALIIRSATQVTKEIIERADNLKIIGRAGIGLDNVDVEAATHKGIIVANAPESNIISAAEHAMALLLAVARDIPLANTSLKSGKWERSKFEGIELFEKTLGVLGLGKIGSLVAERAKSFGMNIIAYDPYVSEEKASEMGVTLAKTPEDLYKAADFITVHLPKSKETLGMVGAKQIAMMKDGVCIINAARGGIVEEAALYDALKSGKVAGAGLDVYSTEPCTDSPLFELANIVVTPHLGASTHEAQDKAGITIAEQVMLGLNGDFVNYAVNIQARSIGEAVKPFMPLAEHLGYMLTKISEGVSDLRIEYVGKIAEHDTGILTVAVLKGMLSAVVHEPVTYVNAPMIAKDRGIQVSESKTATSRDYTNLITVGSGTKSEAKQVSGTLFGLNNQPRFVSIYDFDIDIVPSKYMAFFQYKDIPGMIGKVGTILGDNGINIANMQVGRQKVHGDALMGVNVDTMIPDAVMEEISRQESVSNGFFIELP